MTIETEIPASRLQLGLMWSRMKKASRLDQQGVLELKTDTTSTGQAVSVLVLSALAYGIGYTAQTQFQRHDLSIYGIIVGSLANTVTVCFAAFVWSATVFLVGTKLFQGKTGYWQLARPLFFSTAPGILFILIAIPFSPMVVTTAIVAAAWIVWGEFVALKSAMGFNTQRTLLTSVVGLLILVFIQMTI